MMKPWKQIHHDILGFFLRTNNNEQFFYKLKFTIMKKVFTLVSALSMVAGSAVANDYDWNSGLENPQTDKNHNVVNKNGLKYANKVFTFSVNNGDKVLLGVNGENLDITVNGSNLAAKLESGKISFVAESDGKVELKLGASTTINSIYVESDNYRTALKYIETIGKAAVNQATVDIANYSTEIDEKNKNLPYDQFFSAVKAQINIEAQKVADIEAELKTAKAGNNVKQDLLVDFNKRLTAVKTKVEQIVKDADAAQKKYLDITRKLAKGLDNRLIEAAETTVSSYNNDSLTYINDFQTVNKKITVKGLKAEWAKTELEAIEADRDALKKAAMDELAKFPAQYADRDSTSWQAEFNSLKDQIDNMIARAIVERDYKSKITTLQTKVTKLNDVLDIKDANQKTVFSKPDDYDTWKTDVKELNDFISDTKKRRDFTQSELAQNPVKKYSDAEETFTKLKVAFTEQASTELTTRSKAAQENINTSSYKISAKYQNEPETQKKYEKEFAVIQAELNGLNTTIKENKYEVLVEDFNTVANKIAGVNTKVNNLWTETLSKQKQEVIDLNATEQKKIDDKIDAVRANYNNYITKIEEWKKADFSNDDMKASLNANQRKLFDIVGQLDDTKEEIGKVVAALEAKIKAVDDVEFDPNNATEYRFEGNKNVNGSVVTYESIVKEIETKIQAQIDEAVNTANTRAKDYFVKENSEGKATLTQGDANRIYAAVKETLDKGHKEAKMTDDAYTKFNNRYQGILDKSKNNQVGENYLVDAQTKVTEYYKAKTLADSLGKVSSDYLAKIKKAVEDVNAELDAYTKLYGDVCDKKVKWTVAKSKETTYQAEYILVEPNGSATFVKDQLEKINADLKKFSDKLEEKALSASTLNAEATAEFKKFEDGYFKATDYKGYVANNDAKAKADAKIKTVKAEIVNAKAAIAGYREEVQADAMIVIDQAEATVAAQESSVATDFAAGKLGNTYASIEGALNSASASIKKALADAENAQKGGNLDLDGDGQVGLGDAKKGMENVKDGSMDGKTFMDFINAYLQYISK